MPRHKSVLTTGEIAKICSVAPRTVSKWFDTGQLRGYRIPGSRDRRVPIEHLIRFMRAHSIPLNGLEEGVVRVLVAEQDAEIGCLIQAALAEDVTFEVRTANSLFDAALLSALFRPRVMLVDVDLPGFAARDLFRAMREHAEMAIRGVIALTGSIRDGERQKLLDEGFVGCLSKPIDAAALLAAVEQALGAEA